jgi:di/tricarboxylate transporter
MTWELIFVCAVLLLGLVSFILEKVPTDLTAFGIFAILLLASMLTRSELLPSVGDMLQVFANPAPLTIAAMFVMSAALEKCGAIEVMAEYLGRLTSLGYTKFLAILIVFVGFASAFVNNTAVVVVLLPVVLSLARTIKVPASKMLIPLSYAAIFGGCCTAIGTSTNILVSSILQDNGMQPLSMFELSWVGIPLFLVGLIYLVFVGSRFLPVRETLTSMLSAEERQEYITEAFVKSNSALVGERLIGSKLMNTQGVRLLEVVRNGVVLQASLDEITLAAGDRLILACHPSGIMKARRFDGMVFVGEKGLDLEPIASHEGAIVEGVIGPRSSIIGQTMREMNFRQRYRIVILAVHRKGHNVREKLETLKLQFGDTLLMMGTDVAIENIRSMDDIILLDRPAIPAVDMRKKMPWVVGSFAIAVLCVTLNWMPIVGAMIVAVGFLFITNCVRMKDAYESIDWRILILIYGMLGLGLAMDRSGFSAFIAKNFVAAGNHLVSPELRPYFMLAAIYLCTSILTEVLSNNATVVLMTPIAIGLASTLSVDPRAFVIATCMASSASFATPIGYQTNTYIYSVGGYNFSDFCKVGIPLNLIHFIICTILIPYFWAF